VNENDIKVFVEGATHYFQHVSDEPAVVQVPYLISHNESLIYDFTGIIGISGNRRGNVYFTAPRPMLKFLLMVQGEPEITDENCSDMVGEIANTLSGNARRDLGKDFMISVPVVLQGKPEQLLLAKGNRSFVIPIQWRQYTAALVVSLEKNG